MRNSIKIEPPAETIRGVETLHGGYQVRQVSGRLRVEGSDVGSWCDDDLRTVLLAGDLTPREIIAHVWFHAHLLGMADAYESVDSEGEEWKGGGNNE